MKIALSAEQRQDAEKLLADVTAKERTVETVRTECAATQALLDANAKRGVLLLGASEHTPELTDADISQILVCERKALLLADRLAVLQAKLPSALEAASQAVQPVPDLLQKILAPVLDGLVDEIAHALLPQFGDAALARNAAMQTERVAKFQRFTRCDWRIFGAADAAPAVCEWLRRLLAGELPAELQP